MSKAANLAIATLSIPGTSSTIDAQIFVRSLRAHGGKLSNSKVLCLYPDINREFPSKWTSQMESLDVTLVPFAIEIEQLEKWFVSHSVAARQAEKILAGESEVVAWINPNTIIMNEPSEFLISKGKTLGYRPVHHALIGSRYNEPLDEYWSMVYQICEVPENHIFAMKTHIEETLVRPYFNAGCLIVRPERGILTRWSDVLQNEYDHPKLVEMYSRDQRYAIFIHQAILSGVIMSLLKPDDLAELSPTYNYPVHLHSEDMTSEKPASMDDILTFRHEGFYKNEDWLNGFPGSDKLKAWLDNATNLARTR